jgi:transcriptional regulator with XRE-family HTH domain
VVDLPGRRESDPNRSAPLTAPRLLVRCGQQVRAVDPRDGEITIGRDAQSAIRLDYSWLSRAHVRLRPEGAHWTAVDNSRNGMYVNGVRHESIAVTDAMTICLGAPDGVAVEFTFDDGSQTEATRVTGTFEEDWTDSQDIDPDVARAGAAVAARRRELELTQRALARDKIINAGALIAFEKGRSWPHESTRARLEEVLEWPAGSIAGIREGARSPNDEATQVITPSIASPLLAQTIQLALNGVDTAIAGLPEAAAPDFTSAVTAILSDLRNLQTVAGDAARSAPGAPALVIVGGAVRRRYDELMMRAARAPGAPAGRRLYAARRHANLTAEDAALATGLSVSQIETAESGHAVPAHVQAAIESLLTQLPG